MKWLIAIGCWIIASMVFSPVVGVIVGFLAAVFLPRSLSQPSDQAPAPSEDELSTLRATVTQLERRLTTVEHDLNALKAAGTPLATKPVQASTSALAPTPTPVPPPAAARIDVAQAIRNVPQPPPQPQPSHAVPPTAMPPANPIAASAPPAPPAKRFVERLPAPLRDFLFGGNTLVKVGVLLLFLGLTFLLRYAAERVTVSLPQRYASVMGIGVALLVIGWRLREKRASYALILQGAGIGVFYLTTLAAMKLHALIPPTAGFAFLFSVAVLSAVLAVLQNAMALAVVAALEGFAAPMLVSTGANHPIGLFTYLMVLNVGIFAVAWFKAWRPLHLIGLTGTLMLASAWGQAHYTPEHYAITQSFLIVFGMMFSLIGLLFARRTLLESGNDTLNTRSLTERVSFTLQRVGRVDSALVFGAPLSAYGLQYLLVQDQPLGPALAAVAFGLFELLLARLALAQRNAGLSLLAESYVVVAVLFGTLAVPLGLEGRWTGAAWAIEAAGMFWLGLRQHRPYARVFALAVMGGSIYKLLQEITLSFAPGTPWLNGSSLGPILIATAAAAIWYLHRKPPQPTDLPTNRTISRLAPLESLGLAAMPWLAGAALTLLPWLWFMPSIAPMGTTVLALLFGILGEWFTRASLRAEPNHAPKSTPFATICAALHSVAVLGILSTLHFGGEQAVLTNDHYALLTTVWVAVGLLISVWRAMLLTRATSRMTVSMEWTLGQQLAVLTAATLLHLAPLFTMDWQNIAWLWPLMGTLTLWIALRAGLPILALLAAIVQCTAWAAHHLSDWGIELVPRSAAPLFLGLGFITPTVQALAWLVSAGLLHAAARQQAHGNTHATGGMLILSRPLTLWTPLLAGLVGWLVVWLREFDSAVVQWNHVGWFHGILVLMLLITHLLMRGVAHVRAWPHMAIASVAVLPMLALVAFIDITSALTHPYLPSHDLGMLAWPLAGVWHVWALRRWPAEASQGAVRTASHVGGLWLFTALAGLELIGHIKLLDLNDTAWLELSYVATAAATLYALSSPTFTRRWPVREFRYAYLTTGALPFATLGALWVLGAGAFSAGNAAPLPYVPLINPLELGLIGVTFALLQWQRALAHHTHWHLSQGLSLKLASAVGFVLLTGIVLRTSHHWAGVAWSAEALFSSHLTQAALSLTWATCSVLAMVLGNRRQSRSAWVAGAVLLGVVVLKLLFVELAGHGGIYRIVSFMGVGVLLLLVGYFAPVPSHKNNDTAPPTPQPLSESP